MKRKYLQLILLFLFLATGALSVSAQNKRLGGGTGTAADPYRIKTAEQLDSIVLTTADGYNYNTAGLYFQIDNGILVSSATFASINGFNGNIDGQNYMIKLNAVNSTFKGLFDNVSGATIENIVISLTGFSATNVGAAGPLIGTVSNSTIKNCRAVGPAGYIIGNHDDVGGLIGIAENTDIENCFSEVQLSAAGTGSRIGGLVGTIVNSSGAATTLKNCYATATYGASTGTDIGGLIGKIVNTPGGSDVIIENCSAINPGLTLGARSNAGGLIGSVEQPTSIKNSYSNVKVKIDGGNQAGGLIGNITSPVTIDNCYSLGTVTMGTTQSNMGGLIGFVNANATITNSYSSSPVVCNAASTNVGGLIGQVGNSVVNISYCYANGGTTLTGASQFVGGLIGKYNGTGTIDQTYASGSVGGASGHQYVGGLIGQMGAGTLKNSFASGPVSTNFVGSAYVGGLVGLSDGAIDNCFAANTSNVTGATGSDYLGGLVGYVRGAGTLINSNAGMSTIGVPGTTAINIYEVCGKVDNPANISNNKAFAGMTVNTLGTVTLHDANNERGASYTPQMNIATERQQYFDLGWSDDVWSFNGNPKIPQTPSEKGTGPFSTPQLFSNLTLRLTPQVFVGGSTRACYGNPSTTTTDDFPITGSNFDEFDYRIISEDGTVAQTGTLNFIDDIPGSQDLSANNALQSFTYYPSSTSPTDPNLKKPVQFTVEITPIVTVNGYSPSIAPITFPFTVVNPAPMGFVLPATTVAYYDGATPLPDHEVKVKMMGGTAPWTFALTTYDNSSASTSSIITGGGYNDSIITVLVPTPTAGVNASHTNYYRYYLEKASILDVRGCASTVSFAMDQDSPGVVDTLYVRGAATVTFDSQGGTPVASQTLTDESTVTVPTAPTQAGFAFSGWYSDAAYINLWDFASDLVYQDTILYAKWLTAYAITATSDANSSISPGGVVEVASGSSQTFTYTPIGGYVIDQVLIDGVNDPAAATSGSYTFMNVASIHTIQVTTAIAPIQIIVQPVGGSICQGGTFTFEVIAGGLGVTYQWYKGNNAILGATGNKYQITNATKADYEKYSVLVSNSAMSIRSNEVTLWVAEPLPATLVFAQFPDQTITGTEYTIRLVDYPDVTKYTWYYSGMGATFTPQSGTKNETKARFSIPGTGTVSVDLEHVCGPRTASHAIIVKFSTGIDPVAGSGVKIYPNPVENILTIQGTQAKIQAIRIIDANGQLVYTGDAKDEITTIDLSGYAKGVYLLYYDGKTIKVMKK